MRVYCTTETKHTFVRFGKRFKHGKSINYLAMNPRIKDEYSYKLAELQYGYITEDEFNEWCNDALEDFVWETNTSCFECNPNTKLPVVRNISQVKTLIGFIQRFECDLPCQAFLVSGVQVGTGADDEPLVDISYEEPIEYDIDDLIGVAVDALYDGFAIAQKSEDHYYDEFTHIGGGAFVYKDNLFISPKQSFIGNWEYTGKVMDKFKFESEVDVDHDDVQAIYIPESQNGGYEGLYDDISSWGSSIYEKPYYFENNYHIAVDIRNDGDIYVCGSEDAIWDFVNSFPVDYDEIDPPENLLQKYLSMKFYE